MKRDEFVQAFQRRIALRFAVPITEMDPYAIIGVCTQEAADCIQRAVRAERREWCGDERGGFEQSAYTLPMPWSAAAGKDDEP